MVNQNGWITVVAKTDRPKSVRNRCVITRYCSVFVFTLHMRCLSFNGVCQTTVSDIFPFLFQVDFYIKGIF